IGGIHRVLRPVEYALGIKHVIRRDQDCRRLGASDHGGDAYVHVLSLLLMAVAPRHIAGAVGEQNDPWTKSQDQVMQSILSLPRRQTDAEMVSRLAAGTRHGDDVLAATHQLIGHRPTYQTMPYNKDG